MSKRVFVLHTGGTIGMHPTALGYANAPDYLEGLIERALADETGPLPSLTFRELDPLIDSSNATPATWQAVASAIFERRDAFDGFVVLHGTDTMAYTASALSFLLPNFGKPVVVTGAQVPLSVPGSDGRANLLGALRVAVRSDIPEVTLLFGEQLFRGNRTTKVDASGLAAFASPNFEPLAVLGDTIRVAHARVRLPSGQPRLMGGRTAHVASVRLFPGFEATIVANLCDTRLQGLVLEAYGAGNGPSDDPAFLDALEHATSKGIVVVVVTQCLRGSVDPNAYATGSALARAGAVPGYDLTTEAALAKLSVLFESGLAAQEVRELMQQSLAGELTRPTS